MIRIAFFGLPLAACLLSNDGFEPSLAVLSPLVAPGRRRVVNRLGERVVDAFERDPGEVHREIDARITALRPDLVVSWYWTRRIEKRWLDAARLGGIGAHPSLLPRHRGPNPFFWAIDSGDAETGVTVHRLTERYDEGDVLLQERLVVGERNAWQLARALDRPSLRLLRRAVRLFSEGRPPESAPQDEARATWAPEPSGDALRVDFRWPTGRVLRRIRALAPVPGVALEIRGVRVFVTAAERAASFPKVLVAGEAALTDAGVVVRTSDGAVLLTRAVLADDGSEADEPPALGARALAEYVERAGVRP